MDIKGKTRGLMDAVAASAKERREPDVLAAAWAALYLVGALILANAKVLGGIGPFGVAAVSVAGGGLNGASALVGASVGYILSGGLSEGVRYLAASVMVFTMCFAFHDTKLYEKQGFAPLTACFSVLGTGIVTGFSSALNMKLILARLMLQSFLALGGSWFFREAMSDAEYSTESSELRHSGSVLITIACLLMALSGIEIFSVVSVGRFVALIIVMTVSLGCGMAMGCAVGCAFGLAMDLSLGGLSFYTMAYAFSGLLAGVFNRHGRVAFCLSFIMANAVAVACTWSAVHETGALIEVFCASVVFMLLPNRFVSKLCAMVKTNEQGNGESGLRRYVASRVQELSRAYESLYEIVRRNVEDPVNDTDPARIFDRAADAVCTNCRDKNRCWNHEYMDTLNAMNDAENAINQRGIMHKKDLPPRFLKRCQNPDAFVTAVNGELRARAYRRQYRESLAENRNTAWGQYADMAELLAGVSMELGSPNGADRLAERRLIRYLRGLDVDADTAVYRDGRGRLRAVIESGNLSPLTKNEDWLERISLVLGMRLCRVKSEESTGRLTLMEAEPLAVSVGIAAMKKQGEKVSGDRGTYFKTDAGVLCVILSDGMGSGQDAARESAEVMDILEKFLRSGVEPEVAMKTLNSVMLLRREDNWGFATVDLMCVDLFTGETCFYKYGAAPSYVINGKSIRRVKCKSMAPGLEGRDGAPDVVRMRLKSGSTAVIASDGVVGDKDDRWLREILDSATEDMKLLARDTLRQAEKNYGAADDMTVLAVHLEDRK